MMAQLPHHPLAGGSMSPLEPSAILKYDCGATQPVMRCAPFMCTPVQGYAIIVPMWPHLQRCRKYTHTLSSTKNTFMAPDSEMRAASALLLSRLGMVYSTCRHVSGMCSEYCQCRPTSFLHYNGEEPAVITFQATNSSPPQPLGIGLKRKNSLAALLLLPGAVSTVVLACMSLVGMPARRTQRVQSSCVCQDILRGKP